MSPTTAERFTQLFAGSQHKHGHSQLTGKTRVADGKQETKNWTADGAAGVEHWKKHLDGTLGVGVIPIKRDNSECRFGAIDIDIYNNNTTLEEINKIVLAKEIPVCVCRSKSGGAHLFLFSKVWVPATLMREKLESIAAFLGYANAEIFPAQEALTDGTADGNWINMPYYGGDNSLRYCLRQDNSAMSADEFLDYADRCVLSYDQMHKISYGGKSDEVLFPDGPPCLEAIFQKVRTGLYNAERNKTLFAVSVYANLRWKGDDKRKDREAFVVKMNSMFSDPLPLEELTKTIFSSDKRGKTSEYKYQCQECPLKQFCNSGPCRLKPYGVGAYNGSVIRKLLKIETEPPTWILRVNEHSVRLTTEELFNYSKLQQKVLESTNTLPPMMKAADWQDTLKGHLKDVQVIHTFNDYTEEADLVEQIHVFLYDRSQKTVDSDEKSSVANIINGALHYEGDRCVFLPSKLYEYLKRDKDKDKRKLVDQVLVEYFQAKEVRPNLEPRRRCFSVPSIYTKTAPSTTKAKNE